MHDDFANTQYALLQNISTDVQFLFRDSVFHRVITEDRDLYSTPMIDVPILIILSGTGNIGVVDQFTMPTPALAWT